MKVRRQVFGPNLIYCLWLMIVVALMVVLSCGNDRVEEPDADNLLKKLPKVQTEQVTVSHAQNFSVIYHDGYKVADLHFESEGRNMQFQQKLVLVQRGSQAPAKVGELKDAWFIDIPVATMAANHDGEVIRVKSLGLIDHIAGMGGGDIYDQELRYRWEQKEIASIGYSFHSVPEPELLMSSGAELLILHTYDNKGLTGMNKLRELGINAIPNFAWAEQSFLGKAEWIKFSSLFFNMEAEANSLFDSISERCEALIEKVAAVDKKNTFLLYHPSGQADWMAHRNDFYASYLKAVSNNVLQDNGPTHSVGINNEQLLSLASEADFWIVNSTSDEQWPPANYLHNFKSYRNGNVYHYQRRTNYEHNAYDWYETPEVRPDLVLEDLVSIFYPELLPDHNLVFFQKVKLTKP